LIFGYFEKNGSCWWLTPSHLNDVCAHRFSCEYNWLLLFNKSLIWSLNWQFCFSMYLTWVLLIVLKNLINFLVVMFQKLKMMSFFCFIYSIVMMWVAFWRFVLVRIMVLMIWCLFDGWFGYTFLFTFYHFI
jgi:hypothetical protein